MTGKQALLEAEKIFGPLAFVSSGMCRRIFTSKNGRTLCSGAGSHIQPCRGSKPLFEVGRFELDSFYSPQGRGSTWVEAFIRARFKFHVDTCKKRWMRQLCRRCGILHEELRAFVHGLRRY